jgi:type I restriction enzyme M protein
MPQLEQIEAIEKRLWKAADTLRANSNCASNEYFLPVMGLVFLRHAYSRFLAVRELIVSGLPTRNGEMSRISHFRREKSTQDQYGGARKIKIVSKLLQPG